MVSNIVVGKYTLTRTRKPDERNECDMAIDVGGCFDPEKLRFDHHQRGFSETFGDEFGTITKLSSAGLTFKYLGKSMLKNYFKVPDEKLIVVFKKSMKVLFVKEEQFYQIFSCRRRVG